MMLHRYSMHLRLLGMAILWGASWPLGRVVAQAMPPLAAACIRFVLTSAVLLLWLSRRGKLGALRRLTKRQWGGLTLAAAAGVFGYSSFFMLGLQWIPAGKAAIIVTTNPVATLLLAALLFGERLNWRICLGMVMAVAGAAMAMTGGHLWQVLDGGLGLGEWLMLGCVACWVAYTLIGRFVMAGLDSLVTTTATAMIGAAMLATASLMVEGPQAWASLADVSLVAWANLVALALGATALAYAWYFDGVKALGAGAPAGYITLVPIFGVLFSSLWLGEALDASLLVGGLIAIAGMVAMHLGRTGARAS